MAITDFDFTDDQKPLIVVVSNGQWMSYAQHNPPTPEDQALVEVLKGIGGVNIDKSPGRYYFSVKNIDVDGEKYHLCHLEDIE